LRKFTVTGVTSDPSGPGPDRVWRVGYTAIRKKKHVSGALFIVARTGKQAEERAIARFGEVSS
jgi:hypothetical protein